MCRKLLGSLPLIIVLVFGLAACVSPDAPTPAITHPKAPSPLHKTAIAKTHDKSLPPPVLQGNLWDHMRGDLGMLAYSDRPEVQQKIQWFQQHQEYLNRAIGRAAPYIYYIYQQTQLRHLPAELALIPIVESDYNPNAYNVSGASGLWQFMPGTAAGFGLKKDWWYDGRHDVVASTNAALDYFNYLHSNFDNDWLLAIAAYNWGPGNIQRSVKSSQARYQSVDFWSLTVPAETKDYVPRLLALSAIVHDPERYGIHLFPINDAPYLEQVNMATQINIAQAAKLAGVSEETLHRLNPGYRRWATDPNGPYTLLIPVNNVEQFKTNLAALPAEQSSGFSYHMVRAGETLENIAKRYNTTAAILRKINSLHSNYLHAHQSIALPSSAATTDITPQSGPIMVSNPAPAASASNMQSDYSTAAAANTTSSIPSSMEENNSSFATQTAEIVKPKIYQVKKGDTLWRVANKYHVTPQQISEWNQLGKRPVVKPGMRLLIQQPNAAANAVELSENKNTASQLPGATVGAATDTQFTTKTYKVKRGDELTSIARRFHTTPTKLRQANQLTNNTVKVGQNLLIPEVASTEQASTQLSQKLSLQTTAAHQQPTKSAHSVTPTQQLVRYTVRNGDVLTKIAARFHVTVTDLKRWNHLTNNKLQPGKKLIIYKTT